MKSKIMKMMVALFALTSICTAAKQTGAIVKDADGNKYPTMKIGKQVWMAKNLNVKTDGSWCYDNDPANCEKYGRLYAWDAAMKACPSGWHLPGKEEMEALIIAVEARVEQIVTPKKLNAEPLKIGEGIGINHLRDVSWEGGFDTFGFSVLPAGQYDWDGGRVEFRLLDRQASFWSSTEDGSQAVFHMDIKANQWRINDRFRNFHARSVRCLKDN